MKIRIFLSLMLIISGILFLNPLVNSYYENKKTPYELNQKIANELLKQILGFAGLSFTIFIVIWLIPYEAGKQKKTREARTRKEIEDAIIEEAIEEAEEDE